MKILFWVITVLMVPVYLLLSFFFELSKVVGYSGVMGTIGSILSTAGTFTAVIGIVGLLIGVSRFRKGKTKQAFFFVLIGLIYGLVLFVGVLMLDEVSAEQVEQQLQDQVDATYGENWDEPSAIEGIPEQYEKVLSQFYVAVTNSWDENQIMDGNLFACTMPLYYGDVPENNIGFVLQDLNGDGVEELIIGTVSPHEGTGTAIFGIYIDPTNPFAAITAVEGEVYYLHPGEDGQGSRLEIDIVSGNEAPEGGTYLIRPAQGQNSFEFDYQTLELDPDSRIALEMTPFSAFK